MIQANATHSSDNPFATRYVRPGKTPYFFPAGECAEHLLHRLDQNQGWGQIVGPHGSGKSTLLEAIIPLIESQGKTVVRFSLHDRQRKLPVERAEMRPWGHSTQVVVDGFEQLSWWNRKRLLWRCARQGIGLLITAHRNMGLPLLYRSSADPSIFLRLIEHLLGRTLEASDRQEAIDRLNNREGNVRESLFDLYDLYERRRS